ncbi:prolyl-tRNA synthetase [Klosneuvirus KNV1]|uniref:proline--tRNA ligase n=1 Tax=Klosneuvirus KNV1 TaxID=1977640 RepID=A0A1V0SJ28_9VIRU|nr:prolyl-tRNA synthetase [Klosneuvirus KNV1]
MDHELGLTVTKTNDFSEWYTQLITKGKFIEYYDVSGCYVLLPNSFAIWENIQKSLDNELKKRDVQNVQFPLFISEVNLSKEETHLEGFSAEVAWLEKRTEEESKKDGETEQDKIAKKNRIAVRPTSECAMYPIFKNLIRGHSDLPLKYNQWCNVVRWEMKHCTPFIRSREFFWSELHSCYTNRDQALNDVTNILDLYKETYNNLLAIPVIRGIKTNGEKFAGAELTQTVESYVPVAGKGIQAATSHLLGQNFSKMFDIKFQDENGQNQYVWQISCGITTRSIGIMLMTHGDNKGAVLPPKVAPIQIVIIPIIKKGKEELVLNRCKQIYDVLKDNFRVKLDTNPNHNPGWKYNYYELRGVPLRIEIGPKDADENTLTLCKRTSSTRSVIKTFTINETNLIFVEKNNNKDYTLNHHIEEVLNNIHQEMYDKALQEMMSHIKTPQNEKEFGSALNEKSLCYIKWCDSEDCEKEIKTKFHAKSLCIPSDLNMTITGDKCCVCQKEAKLNVLFGKSF